MAFVEVPFTTSADQLAVDAINRLQDRWDGWEPNDGDLEVIQIETVAPMAQDAVEVAASVPEAIFRNYGTQLVGEAYRPGQPAVGQASFTAIDATGYSTEDVVQIAIGQFGFQTDDPLVIAPGQTSISVAVTAIEDGIEYNGQSGIADLVTALPWVDLVTISSPTGGGVEPETDEQYADRLSEFLRLQSTTLVTAQDFVLMALQQPGVGRATASFSQAREVTVTVTDAAGELVPTQIKTDLAALYADYRQVNTLYEVIDPNYTTITVTFSLVALPGYDLTDVHDRAIAAAQDWLSPANWGRPVNTGEGVSDDWLINSTVVRYSELVRVLSVNGVRYVDTTATTLNGGTADVTLPTPPANPVPLTRPGTITGTVAAT